MPQFAAATRTNRLVGAHCGGPARSTEDHEGSSVPRLTGQHPRSAVSLELFHSQGRQRRLMAESGGGSIHVIRPRAQSRRFDQNGFSWDREATSAALLDELAHGCHFGRGPPANLQRSCKVAFYVRNSLNSQRNVDTPCSKSSFEKSVRSTPSPSTNLLLAP